jgi:serine/threonine protein kinase
MESRLVAGYGAGWFQDSTKKALDEASLFSADSLSSVRAQQIPGLLTVGKMKFSSSDVVGEGSMGTVVYRGTHADWGDTPIAIKKIRRVGEGQTHRMDKETRILQRLSTGNPADGSGCPDGSAHVVNYIATEEEPGNFYIGLEFCVCSLFDVVRRPADGEDAKDSTIPHIGTPEQRMRVARQLLAGAEFLHTQGLVHSDIRPRNVLFTAGRDGQLGILKLADFDLCRENITVLDQSFTYTYKPNGMGGWYAPEVHLPEVRTTAKVDVFMLGCCLYYILTEGCHPFDDPQAPNAVTRVSNVARGRHHLDALKLAVWPGAHNLLDSMIRWDANERPTVKLALEHPFFWNDDKRYDFLCVCGNIEEIKKKSEAACAALPSTLLPGGKPWSLVLDQPQQQQLMALPRVQYDTNSVPDLLRFIRNASDLCGHNHGNASDKFPWLLLAVWQAVIDRREWREMRALKSFITANLHAAHGALLLASHKEKSAKQVAKTSCPTYIIEYEFVLRKQGGRCTLSALGELVKPPSGVGSLKTILHWTVPMRMRGRLSCATKSQRYMQAQAQQKVQWQMVTGLPRGKMLHSRIWQHLCIERAVL